MTPRLQRTIRLTSVEEEARTKRPFDIGDPGRPRSGSQRWNTSGGRWMDLTPDFDEFIGSLIAHGVKFVVVGAYALAFHGSPRFTYDSAVLGVPKTRAETAPA